jgi:hypothetical protein
VLAARGLSALAKLVFSELRGLSCGRGASIGAGPLGLRLGVSRDAIERARRELVRWGLVRKLALGRGRRDAWFPRLAEAYHPRTRSPDDDLVQKLADALAADILKKCASGGGVSAPGDDGTSGDFPGVESATVAAYARHTGAPVPPVLEANPQNRSNLQGRIH